MREILQWGPHHQECERDTPFVPVDPLRGRLRRFLIYNGPGVERGLPLIELIVCLFFGLFTTHIIEMRRRRWYGASGSVYGGQAGHFDSQIKNVFPTAAVLRFRSSYPDLTPKTHKVFTPLSTIVTSNHQGNDDLPISINFVLNRGMPSTRAGS
ncbi:hypothetical protein M404DRAFT_24398 [Pisolithus tinctorius Marx 270]|uniref:Uncharacterized protein n=1 Tax=Pisolithus tinctorius Marx 270 TaxID=870435 RepID=A0A0C3PFJ8_PISTI|nr:hypothetical protein M404DRAFT_24398 [Pisolithus tinctorius Marx 270]